MYGRASFFGPDEPKARPSSRERGRAKARIRTFRNYRISTQKLYTEMRRLFGDSK